MLDQPDLLTAEKSYTLLTTCFHLPEKSKGEEGEAEWLGEQQTLFLPDVQAPDEDADEEVFE